MNSAQSPWASSESAEWSSRIHNEQATRKGLIEKALLEKRQVRKCPLQKTKTKHANVPRSEGSPVHVSERWGTTSHGPILSTSRKDACVPLFLHSALSLLLPGPLGCTCSAGSCHRGTFRLEQTQVVFSLRVSS